MVLIIGLIVGPTIQCPRQWNIFLCLRLYWLLHHSDLHGSDYCGCPSCDSVLWHFIYVESHDYGQI